MALRRSQHSDTLSLASGTVVFLGVMAARWSSDLQRRKAILHESTPSETKNSFALTFEVPHLRQAWSGEFANRCSAGARVGSSSAAFSDREPRAWQVSKVC